MEIPNKKPMWVYPKSLGLSPSQRWGHSACYFHGVLYIFGGCCGGLHFSDVLALNLTTMTWTMLATTGQGPGPRDSHTALVAGHKMIVFGGTDGSKKVNDLHMLDLLSKEWSKPVCSGSPPTPRESHTSTLIGDDTLVIFGGSGEGEANYLNDLYVLDLKNMRWSSPEVKGEIPIRRDSHGSVGIGHKMFVYGGDCGDRYNGDVDVLDTAVMTWSRMVVRGSLPGVRAGHAIVNIGTKIYVVGGVGDKCYYNDVWVLDVNNYSWSKLEVDGHKPQGRFSHTAIFIDPDIAIYGGCGEDERPLNELLVLRLGTGHPSGQYNISTCKMFKNQWNGKKRFIRGSENKSDTTMLFGNNVEVSERKEVHEIDELELNPSIRYGLDMLHPKRRRTSNNSKAQDLKTEQEDSVQLPEHSSSSHSDQEQAQSRKKVHEPISHGFPMFSNRMQFTKNFEQHEPRPISSNVRRVPRSSSFMEHRQPLTTQGQFLNAQQRFPDATSALNMVGSEVNGKIDAAFDSGYLMTAVVNGRIFRGVLFSPAPVVPLRLGQAPSVMPSSIPVAVPIHCSNGFGAGYSKPASPPVITRHYCPSAKGSSPPINKETAAKVRCDLEGIVLTLGGPGSSPNH
ncbi:unnamed protein product [Rhodiola kirilowii]